MEVKFDEIVVTVKDIIRIIGNAGYQAKEKK